METTKTLKKDLLSPVGDCAVIARRGDEVIVRERDGYSWVCYGNASVVVWDLEEYF